MLLLKSSLGFGCALNYCLYLGCSTTSVIQYFNLKDVCSNSVQGFFKSLSARTVLQKQLVLIVSVVRMTYNLMYSLMSLGLQMS